MFVGTDVSVAADWRALVDKAVEVYGRVGVYVCFWFLLLHLRVFPLWLVVETVQWVCGC